MLACFLLSNKVHTPVTFFYPLSPPISYCDAVPCHAGLDILGKVTSNNAESQNAAYSINRSFDGAHLLHLSFAPTFSPTFAPAFVPSVGPIHLSTVPSHYPASL